MKKTIQVIGILLSLLLLSCNSKKLTKNVSECTEKIDQIIVYKKLGDPDTKKITITNKDDLVRFCTEMQNLQKIEGRVNVQSNFGFYEVLLYFKGEQTDGVNIFYAAYDGVVIDYNGEMYKNNKLEWLMLQWFDKTE